MNKDIAKKWCEALRSGKYRQAGGRLKRDECFCCLGVLCDLFTKETGKGTWRADMFRVDESAGGYSMYLPQEVVGWAELKDTNGAYPDGFLANDNDSGKDFPSIATIIEQNVEAL